jgi:hypothetical protein
VSPTVPATNISTGEKAGSSAAWKINDGKSWINESEPSCSVAIADLAGEQVDVTARSRYQGATAGASVARHIQAAHAVDVGAAKAVAAGVRGSAAGDRLDVDVAPGCRDQFAVGQDRAADVVQVGRGCHRHRVAMDASAHVLHNSAATLTTSRQPMLPLLTSSPPTRMSTSLLASSARRPPCAN